MITCHLTADPFSPAAGDPNDVMAAFGGAANPNGGFGGAGVSPVPANPWDMGGLDPLPLLGQNNGQVVKDVNKETITKAYTLRPTLRIPSRSSLEDKRKPRTVKTQFCQVV